MGSEETLMSIKQALGFGSESVIDLELIRGAVQDVCRARERWCLFKTYGMIEAVRDQKLEQGETEIMEQLSALLLDLNVAARSIPPWHDGDTFATTYFWWKAIRHSPKLMEGVDMRALLEQCCLLGANLTRPEQIVKLAEYDLRVPATLYRRVGRVHRALALLEGSNQIHLENSAAEYEVKADELDARAVDEKLDWTVAADDCASEFTALMYSGEPAFASLSRSADQLRMLIRNAPRSKIGHARELIAIAIKQLKQLRSKMNHNERRPELSRIMAQLALDLCQPVLGKTVPQHAFDDRFEVYDALRWERNLRSDDPLAGKIEIAILEGMELGRRYRDSPEGKAFLENNEATFRSYFHSRHAELCRAAVEYDLVEGQERQFALSEAIAGFRTALREVEPPPPKIIQYNSPRLSECLRLAGHFKEAEDVLRSIANASNLPPKIVWDARRKLAIGLVYRAKTQAEDEPKFAESLLEEAVSWCTKAAHIWEPDLDITHSRAQREENSLIHSLLSWICFEAGRHESTVQQAEFFIASYPVEKAFAWQMEFLARAQFVRCQALVAMGNRQKATEALRELLAATADPCLSIRPLVLLATVLSTDAPEADLRHVLQLLQDACKKVGPKYACVAALTPLQLHALVDADRLRSYIKRSRQLLRSSQVGTVLEEIPHLIQAFRLLFETESPALLTLRGQALAQLGDEEGALRTLQNVIALEYSSRSRGIAWMEIGKIYLGRGETREALSAFKQSYFQGGCKLGPMVFRCQVLRSRGDAATGARLLASAHIAPNETHRAFAEHEWRSILLTSKGLTETTSILKETSDPEFVEMLARALTVRHDVPQSILLTSLERATDPALSRELRRAFVKLVNRAVTHAYFEGMAAGKNFSELLYTITERFLVSSTALRRELIFQLLVSGRDAPLAGTLARYANAAFRRIDAVLRSDTGANREGALVVLRELNEFLRDRLPADFRPSAYARKDRLEVTSRLRGLCTALRGLAERVLKNGNRLITTIPDEPQWTAGVAWLRIEDAVRTLTDPVHGPLAPAMVELIPWVLTLRLEPGVICISFRGSQPDEGVDMVDLTNATWDCIQQWFNAELDGITITDVSQRERFTRVRELELKIPFLSAQEPSALERRLGSFTDFLHAETTRFLNCAETTRDFFIQAGTHFPDHIHGQHDSILDWTEVLHQLLDQQFAHTADWLCSPAKGVAEQHPRRILHNLLKKNLELTINRFEHGGYAEEELSELRELASTAADRLIGEVRAELFDAESFVTHAGHSADELIKEFRSAYPTVRTDVSWTGEPWVRIHEQALRNFLRNLFHNAFRATEKADTSDRTVIIRVTGSDDDNQSPLVDIVITNPHHPTPPDAGDTPGTGIGIQAARQAVDRWGGTFHRDAHATTWNTHITLPSVIF